MIVRVAAAIIRRDDRFLITQRPDNVHLAGLWEFPGGKIEENESPQSALVREIKEEIDVDIQVLREYLAVEHHYAERSVQLYFLECRIISGEPRPLHVADLRWVKASQLDHFEFPEADRELIHLLKQSACS